MSKRPLILVSPSTERKGSEFADASISLSNRYADAIAMAGGIPMIVPCLGTPDLVAECVCRADGVLLTGGEDVQPHLYAPDLGEDLLAKVGPREPERDELELRLIDEVFRQRRALMAICRGHQILNVALGGTLIVDIPTQKPGALNHRQMDLKNDPVHTVELTADSALAKVFERQEINVNSTHHQAVDRVAQPLKVVATSKDGIVEAMELKDKQMLPFLVSVQFHPERLVDRHPEFIALFKEFANACAHSRHQ